MGPKKAKKRNEPEEASCSRDSFTTESNLESSDASGSDADKSQYGRVNRVTMEKNSEEYRKKRQRNNIAVKKSRKKSKIKTMETLERVNALKAENEQLLHKTEIVTRELELVKSLLANSGTNVQGDDISDAELKAMFSEETFKQLTS